LKPAASAAEAIRNADLICCATTSAVPVLNGQDLKPGAHVNGVGAYTTEMQEIDLETVRRAGRIFVDSRESVLAEAGDVVKAMQQGILQKSDLIEIGAVLNRSQPGRASSQAVTLFKSCGLAAQDVVAAGETVRRARALNLGVEVDL
jgi:ornithine cyclodeaminase/alanine dehydrogenase-like protein (mu-crystallin family)